MTISMVMAGGARFGSRKGKAMLALYGYAILSRRCHRAMAHSVILGPLYTGDLRPFSSNSTTAASKPDGVAEVSAVHDRVGAAFKINGGGVDPKVAAEYRQHSRGSEQAAKAKGPTKGEEAENTKSWETNDRNSTSSDAELAVQQKGAWKRFVATFMDFANAAKLLWAEYQLAGKAKARLEQGYTLSWRERRLVRGVPRDLWKAGPILLVFGIPIVGYIAPIVGVLYPKNLLPRQFWSSAQHLEYMLQDAVQQELSYFPALLRCLAAFASPPRPSSTRDELLLATGWFDEEGHLDRLSREHLRHLIQSCNVMPIAKKLSSVVMPKRVLVSWLDKEAAWISEDDLALLELLRVDGFLKLENNTVQEEPPLESEGITTNGGGGVEAIFTISPQELRILCWERGLLRSQQEGAAGALRTEGRGGDQSTAEASSMLLQRLEAWLSLYAEDDITRTIGGKLHTKWPSYQQPPRRVPASMVLHAPALLRLTGSGSFS